MPNRAGKYANSMENEEEITQAVTELRNMGVWVDPGGHDAIDHDRAEVV